MKLILLSVVLILIFANIFSVSSQNCSVSNSNKIDCGYVGITESQCESKGCCWVPNEPSNVPWCFTAGGGGGGGGSCGFNTTTSGNPFTQDDFNTMQAYFLKNIDIQNDGGVAASPSTSNPDYYYHWTRDGALSMKALLFITNYSTSYDSKLQDYVQWVLRVHALKDPNGIDIRVEPKYYLPQGGPYTGGWCRPQTDGPALQVVTLSLYALNLIDRGQKSYVQQYLWTGNSNVYLGGAIKYDLDWIVSNWQSNSCDLWEEIQSNDFFWNRMAFKKALLLGAQIATAFGDSSNANLYTQTAAQVGATLGAHFNGQYIYESTNRLQDGATIVALNEGYADDGVYAPTDSSVALTIQTLNSVFCSQYPLNTIDLNNGIPGILYGRYPGDTYYGGNPWILTSGALAQLFYRGATLIQTANLRSELVLSNEDRKAWNNLFNLEENSFSSLLHNERVITEQMTSAGDAVLQRIYAHTKSYSFHLSEQIDKNTGAELSAVDLTWSYATVLQAIYQRNLLLQL